MKEDVLDQVAMLIAYENDELSRAQEIELFQSMVDSGLVWALQGSYGRTANRLITAGLITRKEVAND